MLKRSTLLLVPMVALVGFGCSGDANIEKPAPTKTNPLAKAVEKMQTPEPKKPAVNSPEAIAALEKMEVQFLVAEKGGPIVGVVTVHQV